MRKRKELLTVLMVAALILGFSASGILRPAKHYSDQERRSLAWMPELTAGKLQSGKFMDEFEEYAMDQFPLRDSLRSLKAATVRGVLGQRDDHGLYMAEGYVSRLTYPLNETARKRHMTSLQVIYQTYLEHTQCNVYLSVIPDKNYFLASRNGYPAMDYEEFVERVREDLDFAEYIDLFLVLSLEDYYRTDQHWRQECLLPVAKSLADAMGTTVGEDYTVQELETPFYGAYAGQLALPVAPDSIRYLTGKGLEQCKVTSYDTGRPVSGQIYDMERAKGKDPYEMFLSGSDALVVIENPNADTDRELVIFRDSFASSLAPLLTSGYARITLVDLRYIQSERIGDFVEFTDQDVLFLYSTLIWNQ